MPTQPIFYAVGPLILLIIGGLMPIGASVLVLSDQRASNREKISTLLMFWSLWIAGVLFGAGIIKGGR